MSLSIDRAMQRPAGIARCRASVRWLLLAACAAPSGLALPPRATAQTTTTAPAATSTSIATTTTTTTTTTLPRAVDFLGSLANLATRVRKCHQKDALRTSRRVQLEASCHRATPLGRSRRPCERKLRRARCRGLYLADRCEHDAAISALLFVGPTISNELLTLLRDSRQAVQCVIPEQTPDPDPPCPSRPPKRVVLPRADCGEGTDCACATAALSAVPDAVAAAADCRRSAILEVIDGKPFDEPTCVSDAWSKCVTAVTCGCVNMVARCEEARVFVERIVRTIASSPCADADGFVTCDDGNPCSADRCDRGEQCVHTPTDGATCPDDGNPCTRDVCSGGHCGTNLDGGPCADEDTDDNPCTLDVCKDGKCAHPSDETKRCKSCDGSNQCMICVSNETTSQCVPRPCGSCACHPDQGCVGFCDDTGPTCH